MYGHGSQLGLSFNLPVLKTVELSPAKPPSKEIPLIQIETDTQFVDVLYHTAQLGQMLVNEHQIYRNAFPKENLKQIRKTSKPFDAQYKCLKKYLKQRGVGTDTHMHLTTRENSKTKKLWSEQALDLVSLRKLPTFTDFIIHARTICPDLGDHLYSKITNERGSDHFGAYAGMGISFLNH